MDRGVLYALNPTPEQALQHTASRAVKARLGLIAKRPTIAAIPPPKTRDILSVATVATFTEQDPPCPAPFQRGHWKLIVREVCEKHAIGLADIMSCRRDGRAVSARQEAMYRMHSETTMTYPEIGKRLGGKDHTTVMYGVRRHKERMEARQP